MAATNRPARLNRVLLALLGLVLLLGGAFGVLFGIGLLAPALPVLDPSVPLIPTRLQVPPWTPYAAIAIAVVVGLLCLRWLLAQGLRRPATGTWRLHRDTTHGVTLLGADTVARALADDIETYAGVHKASATLTGTRTQPKLHLDITTEERTSISALRERITTTALPRLCQALQIDAVPADLLLRVDTAASSASRTH